MNNSKERIVWIDVETTGLNASSDRLLQVACIVTDGNLEELHEGYESKVFYSKEEVAEIYKNTPPFVQEMHTKTGLWENLPQGKSLGVISDELLAYVKKYVKDPRTARLGGNSITLDRNFLEANLPEVFNYINYRSYDMSSVSGFFELFAKSVKPFEKKATHDALSDIRESIAEARHYADVLTKGDVMF